MDDTHNIQDLLSSVSLLDNKEQTPVELSRALLDAALRYSGNWDDSTKAELYLALGQRRYREGRTEEALQLFDRASKGGLNTGSDLGTLYQAKGLAELREGYTDAAIANFKQGLSIVGDDVVQRYLLVFDLALACEQKGDLARAGRILRELSFEDKFRPNERIYDPALLERELGLNFLMSGNEKEAKKWLDLAAVHAPSRGRVRVLVDLSEVRYYLESERPNTNFALDWLQRALESMKGLEDPMISAEILADEARAHALQGILGRRQNPMFENLCHSDGEPFAELRCARDEVQRSNEIFQRADYKLGEAYNYQTYALILDRSSDEAGAIDNLCHAESIYSDLGLNGRPPYKAVHSTKLQQLPPQQRCTGNK